MQQELHPPTCSFRSLCPQGTVSAALLVPRVSTRRLVPSSKLASLQYCCCPHRMSSCCQRGLSLPGCSQVLAAGPDDWVHPASRKAKLWVNLADLQAETHLTDAAVQHIALVCGPRRGSRLAGSCQR